MKLHSAYVPNKYSGLHNINDPESDPNPMLCAVGARVYLVFGERSRAVCLRYLGGV